MQNRGQDRTQNDRQHIFPIPGGNIIACGRAHFNSRDEAQFRYMGVHKDWRGKGVGEAVLDALERKTRARGARIAWCNAREGAVPFYERCGYHIFEQSYLLWGVIPHWKMMKEL